MRPNRLRLVMPECQQEDIVGLVTSTEEWSIDHNGKLEAFTGVTAEVDTDPQISGYRCNGCERSFGGKAIELAWADARAHLRQEREVV